MLDVHPPHHPTHTWKDFFIHIATITVGLLIALGLEQIVEAAHRRIQRAELVESLMKETASNLDATNIDLPYLAAHRRWSSDALRTMLEARPGAPLILAPIPESSVIPGTRVAWDAALTSGEVNLLDQQLRTRFSLLYGFYDSGLAIPNGLLFQLNEDEYRLDTVIGPTLQLDNSFNLTRYDADQRKRITDLLVEMDTRELASMRQLMWLNVFSTAIVRAGRRDDESFSAITDQRAHDLVRQYPEMQTRLSGRKE